VFMVFKSSKITKECSGLDLLFELDAYGSAVSCGALGMTLCLCCQVFCLSSYYGEFSVLLRFDGSWEKHRLYSTMLVARVGGR
jgi:hypothetical protein